MSKNSRRWSDCVSDEELSHHSGSTRLSEVTKSGRILATDYYVLLVHTGGLSLIPCDVPPKAGSCVTIRPEIIDCNNGTKEP